MSVSACGYVQKNQRFPLRIVKTMAMVHFAGKLLRGSGKSQILEPIPLLMLRSRQRVSFATQGPLDLFSVERRPDGLVHVGQCARVFPGHL